MAAFRRFVPVVAVLLAALVAVQTTDLIACADEATAASRTGGYHVDGMSAAGHPSPVPGSDHDDGAPHEEAPGLADCLCHVTFTPTGHLPEVASAPAADPTPFAPYAAHLVSVEAKPLDHVPLV